MTAQAHDTVRWNERNYALVGVSGTGLFDPAAHGLLTRPTTTANWRGCIARYAILRDHLVLHELDDVGLAAELAGAPPTIAGVVPDEEGPGIVVYRDLDLPVPFDGRLLIADGFIPSLYRHMGFHPAWKFEESWELAFAEGRLTSAEDTSKEMRKLRRRIEKGKVEDPDSPARPGWIERTFRLSFGRNKGR